MSKLKLNLKISKPVMKIDKNEEKKKKITTPKGNFLFSSKIGH